MIADGNYPRHCAECEGETPHEKDINGLHIQWTCKVCKHVTDCTIEQVPPPSPICEATMDRIRKNVEQAIMTDSTDDLLDERERTHGDFDHVASLSQEFRLIMRDMPGWTSLRPRQAESLDMIASKIARILAGDPSHLDHWRDIEGYARLAAPSAD